MNGYNCFNSIALNFFICQTFIDGAWVIYTVLTCFNFSSNIRLENCLRVPKKLISLGLNDYIHSFLKFENQNISKFKTGTENGFQLGVVYGVKTYLIYSIFLSRDIWNQTWAI